VIENAQSYVLKRWKDVLTILSQADTIKKFVGDDKLPEERLYRLKRDKRDDLKKEQQTIIAEEREKLKPIKTKLTDLLVELGYEDAQERKVKGKTLKLEKIRDGFRKFDFPMWKNIREVSLKEIFPQIKSHFSFASNSKDWEQDNVQKLKKPMKSGTRKIIKRSNSQGVRFNQVHTKLDSIKELVTEGNFYQVPSDPEMIPDLPFLAGPFDNSKDVNTHMAFFQCERTETPLMPMSKKIIRRCNSLPVERIYERVGESAKQTVSMKQLRGMCDKRRIVERKPSIGWATEMSFNDADPTMCDFDDLPFEELDLEEFSKFEDEINITISAGGVN